MSVGGVWWGLGKVDVYSIGTKKLSAYTYTVKNIQSKRQSTLCTWLHIYSNRLFIYSQNHML